MAYHLLCASQIRINRLCVVPVVFFSRRTKHWSPFLCLYTVRERESVCVCVQYDNLILVCVRLYWLSYFSMFVPFRAFVSSSFEQSQSHFCYLTHIGWCSTGRWIFRSTNKQTKPADPDLFESIDRLIDWMYVNCASIQFNSMHMKVQKFCSNFPIKLQ